MFFSLKLLKKNSKKNHLVKQLQAILAVLNYPIGVDGNFGKGTKRIVKQYQSQHSLQADGIVGKSTWMSLYQAVRHCLNQLCQDTSLPEKELTVFKSTKALFQPLSQPSQLVDAPNTLHWLQSLMYLIDHQTRVTGRYDGSTQAFVNALMLSYQSKYSANPNLPETQKNTQLEQQIWQEIFHSGLISVNQVVPLFLSDEIIQTVADDEDLEAASIKAVIKVKSQGQGFYEDKRPVILFEGHIFWRELKKVGIDPRSVQKDNEDIVYPRWVKSHYKGTSEGEFDRLRRAQAIHHEAALRSASWGMFQIMGFNHHLCGYEHVQDYVNQMYSSEHAHLKAFIQFLHSEGIYRYLKRKDWAHFARRYNGSAYKKNAYDRKLQIAYEQNRASHRAVETKSLTATSDPLETIVNEYTEQLNTVYDEITQSVQDNHDVSAKNTLANHNKTQAYEKTWNTAVIDATTADIEVVQSRAVAGQVFHIDNKQELQAALKSTHSGDTIVINQSGKYGNITLRNQHNLRLKAANRNIVIEACIVVDGNSDGVCLEGLNIHYNGKNPYIIFSGQDCHNTQISHNLISSEATSYSHFNRGIIGSPAKWTSGIRVLGKDCTVFDNKIVNTRLGIVAQGKNSFIAHNLIRFFSEDAIRVQNHGVRAEMNQIEDAVMANPKDPAHQDAIQLIPPADRYEGGELRDVQIVENRIKNLSTHSPVPQHLAAILQGIFGSDGYFINTVISDNRVVTNSDHGVTLNGVKNLRLDANQIDKASNTEKGFNPGIKLYFTRIGGGRSNWDNSLRYSVKFSNNRCAIANLPSEGYRNIDAGGNQFSVVTQRCSR